jgi:hypothetical protein
MCESNLYSSNIFSTDHDLKSLLNTKIKKKNSTLDIKDRYWVYLFQNLKLAVEEIYQTCETDESISECEKAVTIMQTFADEFKLLHQKLQLSRALQIPKTWENPQNQHKDSHISEMSEILYQTASLQKQIGKVNQILAMTNSNPYYQLGNTNIEDNSVYTSNAPSPDYYNRLSDVSSVLSTVENKYDDNMDNFIKSPLYQCDESSLARDWDAELNHSRSTEYYKVDNSDLEEDNSEYAEEKDYYGLLNSYDSKTCSDSIKQSDLLNHDDDTIDEVMLKVYEHEENLARALEREQDDELRSVIEQEVKLTKQLSLEQLKHFGDEKYMDGMNVLDKHRSKSVLTKGFNYKGYLNKLHKHMDSSEKCDNELENELGFIRAPSRAMQIHERILQTSRKTSPSEHRRRQEEKQARAQEKRERFYEDRAQKLRDLTVKINEVRKIKLELLRAKKLTMKAKLQRAEEKRMYLLNIKAKKAADEEQKAHEILFINNLKEQYRRQDILEKYEKRNEVRRHNLEEERIRKQEELKTKEMAAEVRRKEIETQRLTKLKEMQEKRRVKQSQIEKSLLKKEKERIESARAKEKTREQRLAALEAQFKAKKEEEKKRILQKQEEWSKRHESNLEEIRKKAFDMSVMHGPSDDQNFEVSSNTSYERERLCKLCNVVVYSDNQMQTHFRCSKHQQMLSEANQGKNLTKSETDEFNLKCIFYLSDDRQSRQPIVANDKKQVLKKRLKKLKNKMILKGSEYESSLNKSSKLQGVSDNNKVKLTKLIKDLSKTIEIAERGGSGSEISNIDKHCREIIRLIEKNSSNQTLFYDLNGLSVSTNLLNSLGKSNNILKNSTKSISHLLDLILITFKENSAICCNIVLTNKIITIIEVMNFNLNIVLPDNLLEGNNKLFNDSSVPNLIQVLSGLFSCLLENDKKQIDVSSRIIDTISLIVSYGVLNKFSSYFSNIRNFNEDCRTVSTVTNFLNLLTTMTKFVCCSKRSCFEDQKTEDVTQLAHAFKTTSLVGIVSMMYGLLHSDSYPYYKNDLILKQLPANVIQILVLGFRMLNQTAFLDINMLQTLLGEESLSLQLRHITSYLLWYCTQTSANDLLNEIILLIGYFTVLNGENQIKLELGTPPTILQLLSTLPFSYFSDQKLSNILFPTLICCCYKNEKNRSVLSDEISTILLANYVMESLNGLTCCDNNSDGRFELEKRFPQKFWTDALQYFSE